MGKIRLSNELSAQKEKKLLGRGERPPEEKTYFPAVYLSGTAQHEQDFP